MKKRIFIPPPPTGPPPVAVARPVRRCPTCQKLHDEPRYCAAHRCYCNHKDCPAYPTTHRRSR